MFVKDPKMTYFRSSLAVVALLLLTTLATAQVACKGTLKNQFIATSVVVSGISCILQNVNITGDVTVTNGGSISTFGKVNIFGCLHAFQSMNINLGGSLKVNGGLSVMDSKGAVIVGKNSYVGTVALVAVPSFIGQGKMTSISTTESGALAIYGGSVLGGGIFRRGGQGDIKLCGATVTGGLSLSQVNGDLISTAGPNCGPSSITGSVSVNQGTGSMRIVGGKLTASDILVSEQKGDVVVKNAQLSDVAVSQLEGSVLLQSVFADSDAGFLHVSGFVSVVGSEFQGDLNIGSNNGVNLNGNNFGLEVVSVKGNSGFVSIVGNKDFSLALTENTGGITFNNNEVRFAEVTKNSGIIKINGNKAQLLSCADNSPAPVGSGNMVGLSTPGQCAKL